MGYVILWIVCGFIGAAVSRKDKKVYGGLIGFLLGPFGVLISAIAFREQH